MKLGRVSGTVVSTIHSPFFNGRKLLIVDLLDDHGSDTGKYLIGVDAVGAGPGEMVLICDEGNSARQMLDAKNAPVRAVVVGIVDDLNVE